MIRKLVQLGNSLAVKLPPDVIEEFKLKKGQEVEVDVQKIAGIVTIRVGAKLIEDGKVTRLWQRS